MSKLIGTWELIKSDGFDDFLKQLDVGITQRKALEINSTRNVIEISQSGSIWTIKTKVSGFQKNVVQTFEEENPIEEKTKGGEVSKEVIVCEGPSRLVFTSTIGENVTTISRGLLPTGQMAEILMANNIVAMRMYKRIK